jgi:hypothetical protein
MKMARHYSAAAIILGALLIITMSAQQATYAQAVPQTQPMALAITNIITTGGEIVEGDNVTTTVTILNNGSIPASNITLTLYLDYLEIWNNTGIAIDRNSSSSVSHAWTAETGIHNISAMLSINGMPLPDTRAGRNITVQAAPIGDVPTLVAALGVVVLAVLLPTLAQSIRRKRIKRL